eukprot:6362855-Prymnesium_polylepis.1
MTQIAVHCCPALSGRRLSGEERARAPDEPLGGRWTLAPASHRVICTEREPFSRHCTSPRLGSAGEDLARTRYGTINALRIRIQYNPSIATDYRAGRGQRLRYAGRAGLVFFETGYLCGLAAAQGGPGSVVFMFRKLVTFSCFRDGSTTAPMLRADGPSTGPNPCKRAGSESKTVIESKTLSQALGITQTHSVRHMIVRNVVPRNSGGLQYISKLRH